VVTIRDISSAPRIPPAQRTEYHQQIVDFNQKLEEIASRHKVSVFDVYTITHEHLPSHPKFFSDDAFLPSDKGYEFWAEQMWPIIALTIGAN
jgi:lysophospholipase L1-like esterase